MRVHLVLYLLLLLMFSCEPLETENLDNPDRSGVLTKGSDLAAVLRGGYTSWWSGIHGTHPAIGLGVAADAFGMSWADFGAQRMGNEPRTFYNNRASEEPDYRQIAETPWFGCLSAVSSANDVINALQNGVSIDNGGPQDKTILAAAYFLRGVSWGYLGLIFDQALIVDENTDLEKPLPFTPYVKVIDKAVEELELSATTAAGVGGDFSHGFFNGLKLSADQFTKLCYSYNARFLMQWPRTASEKGEVNWEAVLENAEKGIDFNFAPIADGNLWKSYQQYTFAQTGEPPFWARVDQRIIAAFDPTQPARYPEVVALGEPPLANSQAVSQDARLASDFIYFPTNNFPAERGEWHFSHYKHNRNITEPNFAGNGNTSGPMPVFLAEEVKLIAAEARVYLDEINEAVSIINSGARNTRGKLPALPASASEDVVLNAIFYERAIELFNTGPLQMWFDRRRVGPREDFRSVTSLGGLQTGTPAHLPVPERELSIQSIDAYNFGGFQDPEGIQAF